MEEKILLRKIKSLDTKKELQKWDNNEFQGHKLRKGQYDIDYVITLLRIIEEKCHQFRHSPRDLQFSLQQSCKQLISMLEVERDQFRL